MSEIHPTAIIEPGARIGEGVRIGPYSVIGPHVEIGQGSQIFNHVTILGYTILGAHTRLFPGAVIGAAPQDLKYRGERTELIVGEHTTIREYCTLHPGTAHGGGQTLIGSHNLLMAYVHVGHDCRLGDRVIISNAAQLAGHVIVEDEARILGMAGIHQFTRIGKGSCVAACARLSIDVPPYTLAEGFPARILGLNEEGLRRRGVDDEVIGALKKTLRILFRSELPRARAVEEIGRTGLDRQPMVAAMLRFVRESDQGRHGRALEATRCDFDPQERDGDLGRVNVEELSGPPRAMA